jgi:hypothetical protein
MKNLPTICLQVYLNHTYPLNFGYVFLSKAGRTATIFISHKSKKYLNAGDNRLIVFLRLLKKNLRSIFSLPPERVGSVCLFWEEINQRFIYECAPVAPGMPLINLHIFKGIAFFIQYGFHLPGLKFGIINHAGAHENF